ncbi:uncharacterized protein LOC107416141 isoform X1 [Ziziphus jujuba]|uniref:Mitochondrial import inner membrane translocase subunit TIM50 n=2 Tax=Ziziphus jujuba TaxID=326968 RepID=A0ABM3IGJ8_ZIZJJ|nr:uncharacterized protein LOC107416141 isoform X1 [Ziziphus jujuba]XP_048327928.2 uncharacterized protein LOC107416141 isoform X1 [Ziziphus jujuba]
MQVDYLLKVGSTMRPSVALEIGVDTTRNLVELSTVKEKKTKWRKRLKKPDFLQNGSLAHKMRETDGLTSADHNKNMVSALSLHDRRSSEAVVISPPVVKPIKKDDKRARISHTSLSLYGETNSNEVIISSGVVKPVKEEDQCAGISNASLVRMPYSLLRKKLLILDVNGLLADIVSPPPKEYKAETKIARRAIFKRPSCLEFLEFCFERFEVGVWSSRSKKIMTRVIDYLMGDMKHKLLFCWDLSHCTPTGFKTLDNKHKTLVFKDLRKIWEKQDPNLPWEKGEYNESNTLLLDDSPYKALLNPAHTAVFPYPYKFQDGRDSSLGAGGDVRAYLEELSMADDVQKFVEQHPFGQNPITESNESWGFYLRVISSVCSLQNTT